jgi:hypothetical protein
LIDRFQGAKIPRKRPYFPGECFTPSFFTVVIPVIEKVIPNEKSRPLKVSFDEGKMNRETTRSGAN